MRIWSKFRFLFRKSKLDAEMAEEMRLHLEMQAERNRAAGLSDDEARFTAQREFGNVGVIQQQARERRGWVWLEQGLQDLRFAARGLRKSRVFSVVVILTLGLGIAANTAVFTVIDALLLRPLPIADPGRFIVLAAGGPVGTNQSFPYPLFDKEGSNKAFPYSFYEAFRDHAAALTEVVAAGGWTMLRPMVASGIGATETETITVEEVSGNYFPALGLPALLGRPLAVQDDLPGNAQPVAVVSREFWQRRFNSDPAIIGKTVRIDNVSLTIVGVMARGFRGVQVGVKTDLWFPIQLSPVIDGNMPWGQDALKPDSATWIHILGRLRTGVSVRQATAELDGLYQNKLAEMDPRRKTPANSPERVGLLEQNIEVISAGAGYGGIRPYYQKPAFALMILVGIMQLVACANVAGLLLARGAAREREFALRAALGAGRGRLLAQLLTESLLLAVISGLLGILLAEGATRVLTRYFGDLELWADGRVLFFALGTTFVTGIIFGLVPALRLSRRELSAALKNRGGAASQRMNLALVVTQIAFAFVLVAAAGLFIRTFQTLASLETGFQRQQRQLFDLNVAPEIKPEARTALYRRLATAIEALPGVQSASYYQGIDLLGDTAFVQDFAVAGYVPARDEILTAALVQVGPRFFETMGIPLLHGRDFGINDDLDMSHDVPALVISEWSARRLFGDSDPLGKRIKLAGQQEFEVVGVAKDVKYGQLREAPRFVFYLPARVSRNALRMSFVLKTAGNPEALVGGLRAAVQQVDARAEMSGFRTIDEKLRHAVLRERLTAHVAGFFGVLALVLSAMGLFGLMAYNVNRRSREIGIRMALGAPAEGILRLVLRQGFVRGLLGCALGLAGAILGTRFIAGLLYGVPSVDLLTFAGTAALLLVVAILACWLPARRAAKVDPVVALRAE